MSIQSMRVALEKKYNRTFVAKMKDDQVLAVYRRLQSKNSI